MRPMLQMIENDKGWFASLYTSRKNSQEKKSKNYKHWLLSTLKIPIVFLKQKHRMKSTKILEVSQGLSIGILHVISR